MAQRKTLWRCAERMQNLICAEDNSSIFPDAVVKRKKRRRAVKLFNVGTSHGCPCVSYKVEQGGEHQDSSPWEVYPVLWRQLHGPALSNNTHTFASSSAIKSEIECDGHSEKAVFNSTVCKDEYFMEAVTFELDL